jgi:hypothetical protein
MNGVTKKIYTILILTCCCMYAKNAGAQHFSTDSMKTNNPFYDKLMNQHWWVEVDFLLNPIYIAQFESKYRLNGKPISLGPSPRFYGTLPSQVPFSDINETADQSNAIYFNFPLPPFMRANSGLFHTMRFVLGVVHDKIQTSSAATFYKFKEGGTEVAFMLDKNVSSILKGLDFKLINLIFNLNVQAGVFFSASNIYAHITTPDTVIKSEDSVRWFFQHKDPYLGGWGWLTSFNAEVGGVLCHSYFISEKFTSTGFGKAMFNVFKHVGVTVGAKIMFEALYTNTHVTVNGVPGSKLKVGNYGIFFAGPILSIKYIKY